MAYKSYESKSEFGWTRIEMLVSLYRETVETLRRVAESAPDSSERFQHKLMSLSLISAIESGVDTSYGEVPQTVLRLCDFVRHSLLKGNDDDLSVSIEVIQNLHDGFAAIQPEAIELERSGVTSKLDLASTVEVDA